MGPRKRKKNKEERGKKEGIKGREEEKERIRPRKRKKNVKEERQEGGKKRKGIKRGIGRTGNKTHNLPTSKKGFPARR